MTMSKESQADATWVCFRSTGGKRVAINDGSGDWGASRFITLYNSL